MNEQKILDALSSINLWWINLEVPTRIKKSENKRKIFYDLFNTCLDRKEIISISGPRQVGKTTLMGQLIDSQLKINKIDPKRIIYIPVDNELLTLNSDNVLIDCLKVYFDLVLRENPAILSSKVYVYLDEIQSLNNWAKQIKSYYDTYENIKFVISGSSQTKLYTDASESLVGRILFRLVLPFKFKEFLEYNLPERSKHLNFSTVNLRNALEEAIQKKDPKILYSEVTSLKIKLTSELPQIKSILNDYLIKGGYPGLLVFNQNYDAALEKIKTDLELTVYKDIHRIFNTRNSSDLMALLTLLAKSSGQKVNHSNLANSLNIDRRIVANYINHLKLVFLIQESPFYNPNISHQIDKMNKAYLADTGHRNALLGKIGINALSDSDVGLLIQTVVFNHSTRLKFYLSKHTDYEVHYWEDKDSEVDIIFNLPIILMPMEVKSKSGDKGLKAVYKFMEENKKSEWGIIITQDELSIKEDNKILFLPLWAFLLMC